MREAKPRVWYHYEHFRGAAGPYEFKNQPDATFYDPRIDYDLDYGVYNDASWLGAEIEAELPCTWVLPCGNQVCRDRL